MQSRRYALIAQLASSQSSNRLSWELFNAWIACLVPSQHHPNKPFANLVLAVRFKLCNVIDCLIRMFLCQVCGRIKPVLRAVVNAMQANSAWQMALKALQSAHCALPAAFLARAGNNSVAHALQARTQRIMAQVCAMLALRAKSALVARLLAWTAPKANSLPAVKLLA